MGKNAVAGKIRKGSIVHLIYETMMTHPKSIFTTKDILDEIHKERPQMDGARVSSAIGHKFFKMGIIEKTGETRKSPAGRALTVFQRISKAPQPLIYDPYAKDRHGNSKPKKKKAPEIPKEIDAMELGIAMIDYVNHLQDRVRSLALEVRDTKTKADTQVKEATRQVNIVRHEMDSLKKINEDLKTKLANKNRKFNTKDVLDFKRRKAQDSGL